MKIKHLFESNELGLWINPSPRQFHAAFELLKLGNNPLRAIIDDKGDFYIFDPFRYTHWDIRGKLGLETSPNEPLSQSSLYAYKDVLAVRDYSVGDEEVHPTFTDYARDNKNIVNVYGRDVECIDIHGEP